MNPHKQLWILAGGNGAGKSTFYRTQLAPLGLPFVNADLLAKELYPEAPEAHSYEAARLAAELRGRLLQEGRCFCFETVFSHPSKIDFVAEAKVLGYEVILVFIHLDSVALNQARIAQRVEEGGISYPATKSKAVFQGCWAISAMPCPCATMCACWTTRARTTRSDRWRSFGPGEWNVCWTLCRSGPSGCCMAFEEG
jgi:predicted ABC-type ATPase